MDIEFSARRCPLTPDRKAEALDKLARLGRFLVAERAVVHVHDNHHGAQKFRCEIVIEGRRDVVRAHASGARAELALDRAIVKLDHQLRSRKTERLARRHRRVA